MTRKIVGALGALSIAFVGTLAFATPSQATDNQPLTRDKCKTVTHKTDDELSVVGAGIAEATDDGLHLDTPAHDQTAKATFTLPVAGVGATLASFETLRYDVKQITGAPDSRTVAAIKLSLSPLGKTAVMEPLYGTGQQVVNGEWQTWNAQHGDRRWWVTGAADTYLTWQELKTQYAAQKVTAIKIEQGSWNHGTESLVRNLKIDIAGKGCALHNWKAPKTRSKASIETKTQCDGLLVTIYPGDTRKVWKVVNKDGDFIFVDTISGDAVDIFVPKGKARNGIKIFYKKNGKWKLERALSWVKPNVCEEPNPTPTTTPTATPTATATPTTRPTPPPTAPPTTPGVTPPTGDPTPPPMDLVDNTPRGSLPTTGDSTIPTGYILAIGLLLIAGGLFALFLYRVLSPRE